MPEPTFETQVLVSLEEIKGDLKQLVKDSEDHEGRIRRLEKALYYATGAAAILGGLVGNTFPIGGS